jgi:hypothetical protein
MSRLIEWLFDDPTWPWDEGQRVCIDQDYWSDALGQRWYFYYSDGTLETLEVREK